MFYLRITSYNVCYTKLLRERLHVCINCRRARIPKADQQIRNKSDSLPAEEQLHEVVAHDKHQHREREQGDIAEKSAVSRVVVHIPDGVNMNHQRDKSHNQHHCDCQGIDQESDLKLVRITSYNVCYTKLLRTRWNRVRNAPERFPEQKLDYLQQRFRSTEVQVARPIEYRVRPLALV